MFWRGCFNGIILAPFYEPGKIQNEKQKRMDQDVVDWNKRRRI